MADELPKPADQVAAGGTAPPADAGGILDALRSRGNPPQAALANIMGPGPNMGSAFGSGVLSALGGNPGQNPYLAAQAQQQKDAFYQQLNMQRQRDQQADRAFKQNESLLKIMKGTLEDLPEGPARDAIAKTYASGVSKMTGQQFAGPLAAALATKKVDTETVNGVLADGAMGMDPKLIALKRGIPVDKVQSILQTDPKTLERIGLDSQLDTRKKVLDIQHKELSGWAESHGLDTKSEVFGRMLSLSQGRSVQQMSDAELGALRARAEKDIADRDFKEKMRGVEAEAAIRHRDRMAEIQAREINAQRNVKNNPLLKPQVVKWQNEYAAFPGLEQRENRVKAAIALLKKENLIPDGETVGDFLAAQLRAQTKFGRADINAAFNDLQRYGVPMIMNAEKEIAGQPIGSLFRLKSVAEQEVGGVRRISKQWWDNFFQDYDAAISNRKSLLKSQMDAVGVSPEEKLNPAPAEAIERLRKAGYDDLAIEKWKRAKGFQ